MTHAFSIHEALRFGWHKTRDHSALLFQVLLTLFALQVTSAIVDKVLAGTVLGVLASFALAVAGVILGAGFMHIALKLAHSQPAHYHDLVPKAQTVWLYFCTSVVAGLLVFVGIIALIIPGIYLALRFSMARFAVLEGAHITESLRKSSRLTHGHKWKLLWFFLVLGVINLLGALALAVGLLVTIPVSLIAYAHVYLKLKNRA